MRREIRRVPMNWDHPRDERGEYLPCYDKPFEEAMKEWVAGFDEWRSKHPSLQDEEGNTWWDWWGMPPTKERYRPDFESAEGFQVYETVSEGTPITPVFALLDDLVEYLVTQGDFWDGPWDRKAAEAFAKSSWAPSMIVVVDGGKSTLLTPRDSGFYESK